MGLWVFNQTTNNLASLVKVLTSVVNIYLHGAFDYQFLLCHVRSLGRIYIL